MGVLDTHHRPTIDDLACVALSLAGPALEVVLAHRREHVEHERALGPAVRRVLHASGKHVRLVGPELVRDAVDDERLHALEHDAELLVRMAVKRHLRARLEADQVQHRALAEERPARHAGGELERADGVETDELPCHATDYRCPRERRVIVEQRDYHVYTGKLPELVRLYESEGIPLQQEILGGLVGAFTTDVGALSTYTTLWRYDSYAEREEKRGRLQADERWQAFLAKVQPLMHTQQNRILVPTSFSPLS